MVGSYPPLVLSFEMPKFRIAIVRVALLLSALLPFAGIVHAQSGSATQYSASVLATITGSGPNGVAVDSSGNLYFTAGNALEKYTATGGITLIAGSLTAAGSADGQGSAASFQNPIGIACDASGNIYVADTGNNAVRKVTPLGAVTTIAGLIQGDVDGTGLAAEFNQPKAVAVDGVGNVYVVDAGNHALRKVTANGTTTTLLLASNLTVSSTDVLNGFQGAGFSNFDGVAVDSTGVPYVSATLYNSALLIAQGTGACIFKITGPGSFTQIPGVISSSYFTEGPLPQSLAIDSSGNFYVGVLGGFAVVNANGVTYDSNLVSSQTAQLFQLNVGGFAVDAAGHVFLPAVSLGEIVLATPVGNPPAISLQPVGGTLAFGSTDTLAVTASGIPSPSYQWLLDGMPITGAIGSTYTASLPGTYTVTVTNAAGTVTSTAAVLTAATRLIDISSRAQVGAGANILIAGFIISGPPGSTEQVLVRGVGPSLSQFGVSGFLAQPVLTLYNASGTVVATNTGWGTNANAAQIAAAFVTTGAFALPLDSPDCALLTGLPPGAYTAEVAGLNGTTGVGLAEVYEVQAGDPELITISTRAFVSGGSAVEIGGIVVHGSQSVTALLRAVGPTLSQFGVTGALAQPTLSIVNAAGTTVATNIGWSTNSNASQIAATASAVGAFALPQGSADCALILTLAPGSYTAVVSGVNGATGVALVEAYQAPPQ